MAITTVRQSQRATHLSLLLGIRHKKGVRDEKKERTAKRRRNGKGGCKRGDREERMQEGMIKDKRKD